MKSIVLGNIEFELIKNENEGYEEESLIKRYTDYFENFDYVLGDWSYGKLRLKGFNDKNNSNFKNINDYQKLDEYLQKYCSFGCRYFVLKKVKKLVSNN